jgi:glycosyltransferase involved in cell wall biosynthesis
LEPRRVLLLGDSWIGDRSGGLNRYLANLLEALGAIDVDAQAVVLGPAVGAPPSVVPGGGLRQPLPLRLWRFQRAARSCGRAATVVDAHFALNAVWPVAIGALRATPLVVHFQGPWARESLAAGEHRGWRIRAKKLVETAVYRRAACVVVLSSAFKRLLVEDYGVAPWVIEVVRPGVDLARFTPGSSTAARRSLGIGPDQRVALAVRRLIPRMGLDVLLEAWAELLPTNPRALLVIVGEGPERERLESSAARLHISSSVRFLGQVDDRTLLSCYRAADISVVPTRALEGFGLIVLEALACGTPVIATDVDALPEVLGPLDPSLMVPAGEPHALARLLGRALAGTAALPDEDRCRGYAETFSWDRVARRHEVLYEQAQRPARTRLRVVYLDHCGLLSGGELALLRLLPALADVEAHVLLAEDGPLVAKLAHAGISAEVHPLAESARGLPRDRVRPGRLPFRSAVRSALYVVRLARRLRRLRPDLVHTNSLKAAIYGGVAARLAGVPVVWHVRDRIADDYLPPPAVRLVRLLARRLPTAIIANSRATLDTLGQTRAPSTVVPSPVSPDLPRRAGVPGTVVHDAVQIGVTNRDGMGPGRVVTDEIPGVLRIGIVGRLAPWKGQHLFLSAFAQAFPEGPVEAVIVGTHLFGEAAYLDELRQLAERLGIAHRVEFTGFREDVGAELARLDIVVHASTIPEPFGQVVVEGMALGVPVVAADAGGPAEVIDDGVTGLLYRMGDVDALTGALRRLGGDAQLRRELAMAAQARALDFRPDVVSAQVMAVYRRTLGKKWPNGVPTS